MEFIEWSNPKYNPLHDWWIPS